MPYKHHHQGDKYDYAAMALAMRPPFDRVAHAKLSIRHYQDVGRYGIGLEEKSTAAAAQAIWEGHLARAVQDQRNSPRTRTV